MAIGGFLGGLSNLGQIYGYQQQSDAREMELQRQRALAAQQQKARAAAGFAGEFYGSPDPGMQPPPGGPMAIGGGGQGGAPAMPPGAASMPAPPPGQPGAGAPPGGGGMPPPGAGGAPAAPQGQGGFAPPPQQQPGGPMSIRDMARAIKAKHPDIDNETLFEALKQAAPLLNQQGRAELAQAQLQFRMDQAVQKLGFERDRLDEKRVNDQTIAGIRQQLADSTEARNAALGEARRLGIQLNTDKLDQRIAEFAERTKKWEQDHQDRVAGQQGVQRRSDERLAWDKDKKAISEGRYAEVQNTRLAGSAIQQRIKQLNKEVDEFYKNFATPNAEQRTKIGTIKGEIAKLQTQYDGLRVKDKTLPGWTDIMKGKSVEEPPEPPAGDAAPARNQLLDWAKDAIKRGAPRDDVVKKLGEMGVTDTSGL